MIKYARFILKRCVRLDKGTPIAIAYQPEQKEFVNILISEAEKLGASKVYLIDEDIEKTCEILNKLSLEKVKTHPFFDRSVIKKTYDEKGCYIYLSSFSKKNLNGLDEEKIKSMNKQKTTSQKDAKEARLRYEFPWCILAVATKTWADELFPNEENNYEKLWNLIFKITMMDKEKPENAWEYQINKNTFRKNLLNELKLVKLRLKNSIGTNVEIGLPNNVIWQGTSKNNFDNTKDIIVNMPTYEVFTSPNKYKTNGIIISSIPIFLRGNEIKDIKLVFKDGRLIKYSASKGEDTLLKVIEENEGMCYLGECAFVDYNSPINDTGLTYKTILIDENRSCHIALGNSFVKSVLNGEKLTDEEKDELGLNKCPNHVDIMIGTKDLSIIGTDIYGNEIPLFVDGNFKDKEVKKIILNRKER